jgi:hypothetical protein
MNRFNADELKALRRAALALDQSDYEITRRLEAAFDQISLMLDLLHDQSSTDTLIKVDIEIERLMDKLEDTRIILKLVLRERDLELKLAELDRSPEVEPKEMSYKDRIIATIQAGGKVFVDDEGDPLSMDPDTLRRIEQKQQLDSLIDSLYAGTEAEKIKRWLDRVSGLRSVEREHARVNLHGPSQRYRELDAQIPTSKGEAYANPKHSDLA